MSSPGCCCDHVTHGGRKFGWCSGGVGGLLVLGQAVEQAVQLGVGVAPPTTTDVLNPEPADDVDFGICCGIDRVARLGWKCCNHRRGKRLGCVHSWPPRPPPRWLPSRAAPPNLRGL